VAGSFFDGVPAGITPTGSDYAVIEARALRR